MVQALFSAFEEVDELFESDLESDFESDPFASDGLESELEPSEPAALVEAPFELP